MNIQSTLRHNPKLQKAVAEGTPEEPSIILRTPDGNHDLLLTRAAYEDPSLRWLLSPVKNLVASAITHFAPSTSGVVDGVSAIIDLTVEIAAAIDKSNASVLQPVDGTKQVSDLLSGDSTNSEEQRREQMRRIFGDQRKPQGIVRIIASFEDGRAEESISPIEQVLGEAPLLGDFFQIAGGIFQWLETSKPPLRPSVSLMDPKRIEDLRARLSATSINTER